MINPKSSNMRTPNTFNHTTIKTIIYVMLYENHEKHYEQRNFTLR